MLDVTIKKDSRDVIIVDDFLTTPDAVRGFALKQDFHREEERYKVQRSRKRFLWPTVKLQLEKLLGRKIIKWEEHGYNGCFQVSVAGDQVVYHSDQQTYAAVIYLVPNAPPESGTRLIRSKANKLRCPEESAENMRQLASRQMYDGKLLDATAWETVDVIGNRYNRLAVWNARLAHAGMNYFGTNLENGRLVQMYFFDAE